jgi:hypothetical protein
VLILSDDVGYEALGVLWRAARENAESRSYRARFEAQKIFLKAFPNRVLMEPIEAW